MLVELVDDRGRAVGSATVADAHTGTGHLHRAFSVFLIASDGRILLQQRAATKTRFPLLWANTCCGHPLPGQDVATAAAGRLVEELGVHEVPLTQVGVHTYRATDPATGRVEHEYDHVLLGELPPGGVVRPHPDEVAALRWVSPAELRDALRAEPATFAPWVGGVAELLFTRPASGGPGAGAGAGQDRPSQDRPSQDRPSQGGPGQDGPSQGGPGQAGPGGTGGRARTAEYPDGP